MKIKGNCWKFGDNINTDLIIPARYMTAYSAEELGRHCMEDADPEFPTKVRPGDIIVAGENFGCGSSREHAVLALKGAGVALVIARSFARIFFRNAINTGLPIIESPEAASAIEAGDDIEVDLSAGRIDNQTTGEQYTIAEFPEFLTQIIEKGGLLPWAKTL
ncbi:MAG TPA: 3-isopropylmalate dehydratase small subunit [bacterium]|uniref:3-isopropylmalate dehydratase small subunit n=1 Tax=candidate division TA06 bacterium ADurb.Bin417 TaxID=1852828 RepID=A0A1V5MAS3_UNCT6|nr:MAG: 2,3-dimethylmalate dehydratase small subunit [candidate division TA06 bacterium ADurb.Bin417]HNQ34580.1 3-isopropylmalate dehydratase small subunit [bacterium]HNS48508.1 3-isopropylmalate dehydratase small subunit [bacterium]